MQPMPGHEKTLSVMTAPPTSAGSERPMIVMIGISALRKACRAHDGPVRQALRLRGGHVELIDRLEHRRARVPHQIRDVGDAQDHGR